MGLTENAGPLLLRAGLITQAQLNAVYQALRQNGGILAEHLVATGVLDEETLCRFFHERLLVPAVGLAELQRLTKDLTRLIPAEMAVEFRVIPSSLDGERTLILAMADPSHTHAVDEVGFVTGLHVRRAAAPPRAVAWALRYYYGVTTPLAAELPHHPLGLAAPGVPRRRLPRAEIVDDVYDEDTPLPLPVPFDETGGRPRLDPAELSAIPIPVSTKEQTGPADRALDDVNAALHQAEDGDAVARVLVTFLRRLCRRAAFFVMRRSELAGWIGNGIGIHQDSLRAAVLPFTSPSTLRDVVRTRLAYRGPLRDAVSRDFLIDALGWAPAEMLAIPIAVRTRVVGVLYGDERMHVIPDEHLAALARAAEAALERTLRSL